jgi:hypothetical protein
MTPRRPELELVNEVRRLVGTPYRYGGRDTNEGLDCLTLAAVVYGIIGRPFPLPEDYGPANIPAAAFLDWARHWEAAGPEPWAVVDFRPSHCGILLPGAGGDARPATVIHAREGSGVILTKLHRLGDLVQGFWRPAGMGEPEDRRPPA